MYDIRVNHLPGVPRKPYRNGVGSYEGVVAHATAVWNDSDESQRAFFGRMEKGNTKYNWEIRSAWAHYFVDHDSITEFSDPSYKAWGAGATANKRFVHVEICQTKDKAKFLEAYKRYTWLLAKILFDRKLGVTDGVTLVSHNWCSLNFKDTTHTDPISYLATWGITWADVVSDVKKQYGLLGTPAPTDKKPNLPEEDAEDIIVVLSAFWGWADEKKDKDEIHRLANEVRKAAGLLDGYTGLSQADANAIISKISAFWNWTSSKQQKDEYHELADSIRKASGLPLN
jgi:N-acetylmuramoyl-L-alanine amidase CwlA